MLDTLILWCTMFSWCSALWPLMDQTAAWRVTGTDERVQSVKVD